MGFIAQTKASRIEAYTGVNPDELNEEISTTYRLLLDARRAKKTKKQLKEIKLASLMEKRRLEVLESNGNEPSKAFCKTWALAQPEFLKAVMEEDEAEGQEIIHDYKHKQLKDRQKMLYEEARLARDELYRLTTNDINERKRGLK